MPTGLRGLAVAVRQVSENEKLTGLVTATPPEIAVWLEEVGMGQYADRLAPLGGAMLLMQTETTLAALHVLPEHRPLLMEHMRSFVRKG